MAQRLAANQHGGLVQLSPGLILAAGVYLALVTPPRAAVNLVIRDVLDGPGMSLVDGRGILRPVAVDIGAGVDVLPDLFLCRCVRDPLRDLIRVLADDWTETLPSALAVANMDKDCASGNSCVSRRISRRRATLGACCASGSSPARQALLRFAPWKPDPFPAAPAILFAAGRSRGKILSVHHCSSLRSADPAPGLRGFV